MSQFSLQTMMDDFCSPYSVHVLAFRFLFLISPFTVTLCFHTQWRPFLPGLKYEVIDSAYISLYTGKSYSALLIHCVESFSVIVSLGKKMHLNITGVCGSDKHGPSSLFAWLRACQIERGNDAIKNKFISLVWYRSVV